MLLGLVGYIEDITWPRGDTNFIFEFHLVSRCWNVIKRSREVCCENKFNFIGATHLVWRKSQVVQNTEDSSIRNFPLALNFALGESHSVGGI